MQRSTDIKKLVVGTVYGQQLGIVFYMINWETYFSKLGLVFSVMLSQDIEK